MKRDKKRDKKPEYRPYCKPAEHTWVQVIGGKGYDPDWDTQVCVICECYSSQVKAASPRPWSHPDTMIGRP